MAISVLAYSCTPTNGATWPEDTSAFLSSGLPRGPQTSPSPAILASSWLSFKMEMTLRGWDLLWELRLVSGSCQNVLSSFQGCIRHREGSPLFIQVNFSSHSPVWNGPNLSHLFLGLSSDVVIPTAFDQIDVGVRKLSFQVAFAMLPFAFGGGVAVNF